MLVGLNTLIGLPVIWQDRRLGAVERAVADAQAGWLDGLVVRRGIGVARWIAREEIRLLGESCVLVHSRPVRMPEKRTDETRRVFLTTGECVGEVSDAVIDPRTLRLRALEVSRGPLGPLLGMRGYAVQFHLSAENREGGVITSGLLSWMQLKTQFKEEDDG